MKKLTLEQKKEYALELRAYITQTSIKSGGHLASSLGAVEIAIALHSVLNSPQDKILWDVGHQAYAHKMMTGRVEGFENLRTDEGISGFPKPSESEHDAFIAGHASNALSVAVGLARASRLQNENRMIVCVVGDGALTGGLTLEALNDLGASNEKVIIILNDNDMSISKNVGGMSKYFTKLRIAPSYLNFKQKTRRVVSAIPFIGHGLFKFLDKIRRIFSTLVGTNKMFEQLGIRYYGPYDGHDLGNLTKMISQATSINGPVLLHVITKKGKGFEDAENNPSAYHGLAPLGEKSEQKFSDIVGETLCELAKNNDKICAITAAMAQGTGLESFGEAYNDRFFDVGIAEGHAVTLAGGLAKGGLKPFVCLYSSFLQRGYDQIIHDVAIDNLPVIFLIDRAGVVGADGVTHQGVFDLSYLFSIPNLTVLSPKDGDELKAMIEFATEFNAPLVIRYPKSYEKNYGFATEFEVGKWESFPFVEGFGEDSQERDCDYNKYILAVGNRMLKLATGTKGACIINARSVKPLDKELLTEIAKENTLIITLEDNALNGGFGNSVLVFYNKNNLIKRGMRIITLGLSDNFIHTHNIDKAFADNNLTKEYLQNIIDKH
ncbi:MAG: 1-deoxy-D-xylulose-5-phosphate synthase [Defluviitaleaceae bacterium]|nr:1-deoxy-D-xylulose-5-phosphate synthase [Defluviitaleaceae bacterium]